MWSNTCSNTAQVYLLLLCGDHIDTAWLALGQWHMQRDEGVEELHPAAVFVAGNTRASAVSYPPEVVRSVALVYFFVFARQTALKRPKLAC